MFSPRKTADDSKIHDGEKGSPRKEIAEDKLDSKSESKNDSDSKEYNVKEVYEKGVDYFDDHETLNRNNPLAEFLKENKGKLKDLSEEEFKQKYDAFVKGREDNQSIAKKQFPIESKEEITLPKDTSASGKEYLDKIVFKFTTLSEATMEAPSFTIGTNGAKIGRESVNEVCVPSDTRLAAVAHSTIEHIDGSFYLVDGGYDFSASIRISVGLRKKDWIMHPNARFSVGNSVFRSAGVDQDGCLLLDIEEGPLKGERRVITRKGATLGRSSDNTLSIPDRELSRRHSRLDFDESLGYFCVSDLGSTNGTYMQLVGPYSGRYKLSINDHILVGRTGFSINRFDFGISEEMGHRQTMEDAVTFAQSLDVPNLTVPGLSPQSFFGVFDGHGGPNASLYLTQHLHNHLIQELAEKANEIKGGFLSSQENDDYSEMDKVVIDVLQSSFLKTDKDFVTNSQYGHNGSTATTFLVLGKRLYAANVGDSRTMLCRNFKAFPMSQDHKPTREDEHKRIRDAGGFVINNRVMGELAVSRAFGDCEFKKGIQNIIDEEGFKPTASHSGGPRKLTSDNKNGGKSARQVSHQPSTPIEDESEKKNWDQPLITASPDVEVTNIQNDDQFMLLACDGLFDVFTYDEVVEFVKTQMLQHGDAQKCVENLTDEAINNRNSRDNVTVVLVILNKWY